MRVILFRGKRTDNGEWVYGDLLNVGVDYDYAIRTYGGREHGQVNAVNEKTVGQFTGLTDKNGARIFEGDIVKIDDKYIRYVEYSGECAAFVKFRYIDRQTREFSGYLGKGYENYKRTIEVIGNIHDTPELLEAAR